MMEYQNREKDTGCSDKGAERKKLFIQVEDSLNTLNPKLKNSTKYIIKKKICSNKQHDET